MRKTLVAVALACAFPAVYAQSSVTMYGVLDVGVEILDAGNESVTRVQGSGMWSGNRFGIRGSEILGGGYSAIFTLEGRFSLDTGSLTYNESVNWCRLSGATTAPVCPGVTVVPGTAIAGLPPTSATYQAILGGLNLLNNTALQLLTTVNSAGAIFDRQSWLGLVTPYGAVLFGRQYTPAYEVLNRFNVMGDASALAFGQAYNNPAIRMNNAIQYRAEMKGFSGSLMYSFGGSEASVASRSERVAPPSGGDDFWGLSLMYNAANWGVGTAYNHSYVVPYATQAAGRPEKKDGLQMFNVGAWVGFGNFKVYGQYVQRQNDNPMITALDAQNLLVATGGNLSAILGTINGLQIQTYDLDTMRGMLGNYDTKAYHLGASWAFSQRSTLYGVYNYAKDDARSTWATQDAVVNHYGVAYQYQFSPRTSVFATVAFMANSDQARLAPSSAGYSSGWATGFGEDTAAYQFGIRHAF
jgi:predicted porin